MAEKAGKKAGDNPKKTSKSTLYTVTGHDVKRKARACPKCGPGIFMAQHESRATCGSCGFTEWKKA
ncbi:MAG: 30S ribosomal protein S27ae [archaeon]